MAGGIRGALRFLQANQKERADPRALGIMLAALHDVPEAVALCKTIAKQLAGQKGALDDDLDTTFQVLIGLWRYDPTLVGADDLGAAVRLLVAAEKEVGGPYHTHAKSLGSELDPIVNSNVAYFLGLVGSVVPQLNAYVAGAIAEGTWRSTRYESPYAALYFFARVDISEPQRERLVCELHARQQSGRWDTPLHTALALTASRILGCADDTKAAEAYLWERQQVDGSWQAETFCHGLGGVQAAHGDLVTTALVVEALAPGRRTNRAARAAPKDPRAAAIAKAIQDTALAKTALLASDLRRTTTALLDYMRRLENSHEIMLLPYFFSQSLARPAVFGDELFVQLGLANLCGWLAYTVFDDFLDDEGKPAQLPAATFALRRSLHHFARALPDNEAFQTAVQEAFNTIDAANAWEQAHCRFAVDAHGVQIGQLPKYTDPKRLYERSVGHTLTPFGVLVAGGYSLDSPEVRQIALALRSYIAIRQLIDDLHDWEQDCRAGQISYVVAAILRDLALPAGRYTFAGLIPKMQHAFWHQTLPQACKVASAHIAEARKALRRSGLVIQGAGISVLLDGQEAILTRTLQEHQSAEGFMQGYGGAKK